MNNPVINYWKSLKPELRANILTGVAITYLALLPAVTIAQWRSGLSMKALQKENTELKQNIDKTAGTLDKLVEDGSSSTVTLELRSLRDEVIKYRAEQQGRDQILGLSGYGSVALDPLDSISKSIAALEEANASGSGGTAMQATSTVPTDGTMQGTVMLLEDKGWSSVDAFESPIASAKIVGQIVVKVSYPYYLKQNNWYQVELSSHKKGWVQAQFVKEQ